MKRNVTLLILVLVLVFAATTVAGELPPVEQVMFERALEALETSTCRQLLEDARRLAVVLQESRDATLAGDEWARFALALEECEGK